MENEELMKELVHALHIVDRMMKGDQRYEHAIIQGEDPANPECKTPAKLVREAIAKAKST